ncbi:MAG: hypothetical protein C3F06_09855 [Candidatus Methanoperedenaceae archaeon]|nr:MAG: hypothetical protein C3F06_09855 [Candidatus Methanoperedenaceae archaeon]
MIPKPKIDYDLSKKLSILIIILLIFPIQVNAVRTESFFMKNHTGLDFMNGYYKVEVFEIGESIKSYVRLHLISGGLTDNHTLYEGDALESDRFNKIMLNSSFIQQDSVRITIEYPDEWHEPINYNVEIPAVEEKIPNIELTKSADKTTMNMGDVVEFKINLENTGNGTAYNLSLDEKLPQGFARAPGSSFPPILQNELKAGERLELLFALKAVEPGSFNIEPTTIRYGSNTARSNSLSITVLNEKKEKSNLSTVITLDKNNLLTGESAKVTVKITNNGNVSAESILIEGALPKGMEVTEGDLRQVYKKIDSGESEEYSATLKALEPGNYSIILKTSYSDDSTGFSANSDSIIVKENEKDYLYVLVPAIIIIVGMALFIIKRHREYSF